MVMAVSELVNSHAMAAAGTHDASYSHIRANAQNGREWCSLMQLSDFSAVMGTLRRCSNSSLDDSQQAPQVITAGHDRQGDILKKQRIFITNTWHSQHAGRLELDMVNLKNHVSTCAMLALPLS